ncbi:MAG TPA: Rieske (2Fe-2S) protein [Gammaproteobacteria bacterium]|nr:Rieske (2Fe-2S) protein [Gammaproteobacteria bacterium]
MTHWIRVCREDVLKDGESRGFSLNAAHGCLEIFLVCKDGRHYAYHNRCPHTGAPLDWVPDRFLDLDRRFIQCATHDARFRIDTGECVAGPCLGESLQNLELCRRDGAWWVAPPGEPQ